MKNTKKLLVGLSAISAIAVAPAAFGQNSAVTAPVGYRTESLLTGQFNLLGSNLSNPVIAAGALEGAGASTLNDAEGTFDTSLPAGSTYLVKITSGAGEGSVTTATATDATNLATGDDLSAIGVAAGDSYEIRAAMTLTDAFGTAAGTSLTKGGDTAADVVWVPSTSGFERYYSNGTNWKKVGVFLGTFDNDPIFVSDGVFVERRGPDGDIVFVGHVETVKTNFAVETGFNFVSRVLPVDVKLVDVLKDDLLPGVDSAADVVWIPDGAGGYDRFYIKDAGTVGKVGVFLGNFEDTALASGVIIERRGAAANFDIDIPADLDI